METNTTTPETTDKKPATKNTLKMGQIVRLHEWVTAHAADCRVTPDTKLAQIASAELEFTITASNIATMREEIGIEKARKETPPSVEERLTTLEALVAGMNSRFESLDALVAELQRRLAERGGREVLPDTGTIDLPLEMEPRTVSEQAPQNA